MPVGKRIFTRRNLPAPETVKGFAEIPTANICDVMNRNSAMNPASTASLREALPSLPGLL